MEYLIDPSNRVIFVSKCCLFHKNRQFLILSHKRINIFQNLYLKQIFVFFFILVFHHLRTFSTQLLKWVIKVFNFQLLQKIHALTLYLERSEETTELNNALPVQISLFVFVSFFNKRDEEMRSVLRQHLLNSKLFYIIEILGKVVVDGTIINIDLELFSNVLKDRREVSFDHDHVVILWHIQRPKLSAICENEL